MSLHFLNVVNFESIVAQGKKIILGCHEKTISLTFGSLIFDALLILFMYITGLFTNDSRFFAIACGSFEKHMNKSERSVVFSF